MNGSETMSLLEASRETGLSLRVLRSWLGKGLISVPPQAVRSRGYQLPRAATLERIQELLREKEHLRELREKLSVK